MALIGTEMLEVEETMTEDVIAAGTVMNETDGVTAVKKIKLNFNGLNAASVKLIASATCVSPATLEGQQRLHLQLSGYFNQMAHDNKCHDEMLSTGTTYLYELEKAHLSVAESLAEMEKPKVPSFLSRILGAGKRTQDMLVPVTDLLQSCQSAAQNLDGTLDKLDHAMRSHHRSRAEMFDSLRQENDCGPDTWRALQVLEEIANVQVKKFQELEFAVKNAKNHSTILTAKATQIAMRLQTTGRAGP